MMSGYSDNPFPVFLIEQVTGMWTDKQALQWMQSVVLVESTGKERVPPPEIPPEVRHELGPLIDDDEIDTERLKTFVVVTFRDYRTPMVLVFRKQMLRDTFIQLIQTLQSVFHFPQAMTDVC